MTFNKIHPLQYILPNVADVAYLKEKIQSAAPYGVKWVQLRLKNIDEQNYLEIAREIKKITDAYQIQLTINDNPYIAKEINSFGVHVGLNDLPVKEVRKIVGENIVIGATANTLDDALYQINQQADYIGLGPFKYTKTKETLSPVLGLDGYRQIISNLKAKKKQTPVLAIGGIQPEDVVNLLKTGVFGIAVSSAVTHCPENLLKFFKTLSLCYFK